jgi:hypothetical protein
VLKKVGVVCKYTAYVLLFVMCSSYVFRPYMALAQTDNEKCEYCIGSGDDTWSIDYPKFSRVCVASMLEYGPEVMINADTLTDTLNVTEKPNEFIAEPESQKKDFVGTTRDVVIGVLFISGWLVAMWFAVNQ